MTELRIVAALGREFERLESAAAGPRRLRRWGPRTVALVLLLLLLGAAAVGAATGILPVGSVFSAGKEGLPHEGAHTVVGTGKTPVAGRWRMEAYRSGRLTDPQTGEEYQPTGLPCIDIRLLDPPAGTPTTGSGQCGRFRGAPGFGYSALDVSSPAGRRELIVFGRAPRRAVSVELKTADGYTKTVKTWPGPEGTTSDFWLMVARPIHGEGRLRWRDVEGRTEGRGIAVPPGRPIDYGSRPAPKRAPPGSAHRFGAPPRPHTRAGGT